jgi:glycosyltransferase involved in cell wall biosynthesis
MKALQYMALGIPAVCSPVGVNSVIIRDSENGFLAATEEQWIDKLTRLLQSAPLRERMGKAGRRMIETDYSATVHAHRVFGILKALQPVGHASNELAPASRTRSL